MPEPWREIQTRREAVALFWQLCRQVAQQIREVRQLHAYINRTWGRAPRLPTW